MKETTQKGVFRDVIINYAGQDYVVTPSNKLLRQIDAELSPQSLFGILGGLGGSNVPLPALALIIQQLLNAGGGKFTEDEILADLMNDVTHNKGKGIKPLVDAIAACLAVEGVGTKNSESPSKTGGGRVSRVATSSRARKKKSQ